jgi:hypothetical protein
MQAIKELANRLDGRPAQILEHSGFDSSPIEKIVNEIVHLAPMSADEISAAEEEPVLIEWRAVAGPAARRARSLAARERLWPRTDGAPARRRGARQGILGFI